MALAEKIFRSLYFLQLFFVTWSMHPECSRSEYDNCIRIADPLVREAHLVFPDNMEDIFRVCKTWNRFVDCIGLYTSKCFTDQQRRQFNKAVENPIESVHQMCRQPRYQKEYLLYAPCIKSTITERSHCGLHYNLLVDQVEQGDVISKTTLCCSHEKFKDCVQRETRRTCDRGISDGPAASFSSQILDKALSFLQDQCYNYIPNSGDCTTSADTLPYLDPMTVPIAPSEVYPWSTVQEMAAKEVPNDRNESPSSRATSVSWLPSSTILDPSSSIPQESSMLGSRSRPASFGRASSWFEEPNAVRNTQPGINAVHVYQSPSSTQSSRPDWVTVSSWSPSSNSDNNANNYNSEEKESLSSTAWYPVAGNQLINEVDEPNQQGLSKPKNGAGAKQLFSLTIIATVLTTYC